MKLSGGIIASGTGNGFSLSSELETIGSLPTRHCPTISHVSSLSQSVCPIWEFPAFLLHFLSPFPFRFGVSFHFIEVTLTFTLIVRFSPPSLSFHTFPPFYPIEQCLVHYYSLGYFSSVPCYHVFLLLHLSPANLKWLHSDSMSLYQSI